MLRFVKFFLGYLLASFLGIVLRLVLISVILVGGIAWAVKSYGVPHLLLTYTYAGFLSNPSPYDRDNCQYIGPFGFRGKTNLSDGFEGCPYLAFFPIEQGQLPFEEHLPNFAHRWLFGSPVDRMKADPLRPQSTLETVASNDAPDHGCRLRDGYPIRETLGDGTVAYHYGPVDTACRPPLPAKLPSHSYYAIMEKTEPYALYGFNVRGLNIGHYPMRHLARLSGRAHQIVDDDYVALAVAHQLILECRYVDPQSDGVYLVRSYFYRSRTAAGDPDRLRKRLPNHPFLEFSGVANECPLTWNS